MSAVYVFIDPFNSRSSGVTTYIAAASACLREAQKSVLIIGRRGSEKIEDFRKRVGHIIGEKSDEISFVEAPETLYASKYIPSSTRLHIRLHGSRQLGNWLQQKKQENEELLSEIKEINRATMISAPSKSALKSAEFLYGIAIHATVYPNPMPNITVESYTPENKRKALFVGRWQKLKGIDFLNEAIKVVGEESIVVANSADRPQRLDVEFKKISTLRDKYTAISQAKLVIVPSLYETASMVGLEALALSTQVLCWNHIGLVEYANQKSVISLEELDAMALGQKVLEVLRKEEHWTYGEQREINDRFIMAWLDICNEVARPNYMPYEMRVKNIPLSLEKMREESAKMSRSMIAKRKLKKLFRDPRQFFIDSKLINGLKNSRKFLKEVDLKQKMSENSGAWDLEEVNVAAELQECRHISHISDEGKIAVLENQGAIQGWGCVIVYEKGDEIRMLGLRKQLIKNEDFWPFRAANLRFICVESIGSASSLATINRIDVANKERVSHNSIYIFLDTAPSIVEAIRSCAPHIKTVIVETTRNKYRYENIDVHIDAILSMTLLDDARAIRKEAKFESLVECAASLRKIVQELGPKSPDMLLPVIYMGECDIDFFNWDARRFQGIINIVSHVDCRCNSFDEYIEHLSSKVKGIMLLDSLYMRYKSLCETVENGGSSAPLIKACLYDGFLLDVRVGND